MVDEVNLSAIITPPMHVVKWINEPFYYNGILMSPKYNNGKITRYDGKYENLKITMRYDQLRINNSWHKLLKGNNYSDFYFSEIKEVGYKLKDFFNINLNDTKNFKYSIWLCNRS